jgi:hypothetical protein
MTNSSPSPRPTGSRINQVLIVVFVGLLWLPLLDTVFHLDRAPAVNENREAAPRPVFTGWSETKEFFQAIERYHDDHFGFRKRLVRWHSGWKKSFFHEAAVREVIIGRDGWLYTATNQMIEHYTRMKQFSAEDLDAWQKLFETRRDWLAQRGIQYLVVFTPDKQTVYPEHLPDWLKRGAAPSKLDQMITRLNEHSTVAVLDLRPTLLEAKQHAPVYLMTDTHWNQRGIFVSYQTLITKLSTQIPGLEPLPSTSFTWQDIPHPGDLAVMLGQESSFPEQNRVTMTPQEPLQITETALPSAKRVAMTTTRNPKAMGKAIVYHDSFGHGWIPLIGYHFGEVIYIAKRPIDPALIEKEKPIIVIDQIVERILNVKDPHVIMADDGIAGAK